MRGGGDADGMMLIHFIYKRPRKRGNKELESR
jgi:hypothetical protein